MLLQEKEIPIPFSLQSKPLHCCEEHNKSYKTKLKSQISFRPDASSANSMLFFFVLVIWVYLYFNFRTI